VVNHTRRKENKEKTMSFQITETFVQQYADNVIILSQQKGSRLSSTVMVEDGVVGKRVSFERMGAVAPQKVTTRHGDTPITSTPHSRRWANLEDWAHADLVDKLDKIKMLISPESEYAVNMGYAFGRQIDTIAIDAIRGTATTGEEATGSQALPAAQKLALGDGGNNKLNVGKLRLAKRLLDTANVSDEGRYFIINAHGLRQLLEDTSVTSIDFNSVRALVNGELNTFLGFQFIRTELLPLSSGTQRLAYAYQKRAAGLAYGERPLTRMSERADKNYSMQIYMCMSLGAVRIEDEAVVEVIFDEVL
jgi:hypothetical protein